MGTLQEPRKEDAILVEKPGPHDNYSCYRLHASSSPQSPCPNTPPNSRDLLYGVVKEACAQQNVKWPVECQVIQDKVHHIEDWPMYPEAFYEPTGTELRPQPVGDEIGRLVYHYYPTSSVNYFSRSCLGGNKFLNEDVRPPLEDENDTTLQFESRFECGNLGKAVQVSECYYELHLRADMYTSRHTQWFYFAVSNTRKDITYRFSIVNLNKGDSLYNHGMRPVMYSSKEAEIHSVGWRRCATNIVYFKNHDSSENACFDSDDDGEDDAPSYTLTFNVTFPHDHDTIYIAHCYPYSYSDLQEHLLSIQNDPYRSAVCRQRILCRSLAGNPVYLLTITGQEAEEDGKKKRAIVLTARVHPGETPSSWIMKGVLDFLTSEHPKAGELRSQFIFKVIPMLNPDGVIVGNHRCSLVGRDLNRQYKMVVKEMFPSIWHTKAMVRRLMDEHGVVMYGDFHAHSRKHNIFLYGCENRRNQDNHLREQIFPLLLHYNGGDKFSFRSCKFKVHRCKEGTARVVVWMMGVLHSYTMEASFGGTSEGPRAGTHYNIHDFISMGKQFCETLVEYFDPQPMKEKLRNKLWSRLIKKGSNADEPAPIDFSETNSSSGDSDRQTTPVRIRKKKIPRNPRRKMVGGRSSVAQVVDKVTTQMRMDKSDRRAKGLQHSRSGSSGSPVTSSREPLLGDRVSGGGGGGSRLSSSDGAAAGESNAEGTVYKSVTDGKPCLKKLLERPRTSTSVLDPNSGRTSLRPTQYKLEEALPTPCSAPPLRRSSHSLIRPSPPQPSPPPPPHLSTSVPTRESSVSPIPPEKPSTGSVNEHLAHRLNNNINRHRDPSQSDCFEADGRDSVEPRGYLDLTTKSYMERMGELMSSRHAISDTEDSKRGGITRGHKLSSGTKTPKKGSRYFTKEMDTSRSTLSFQRANNNTNMMGGNISQRELNVVIEEQSNKDEDILGKVNPKPDSDSLNEGDNAELKEFLSESQVRERETNESQSTIQKEKSVDEIVAPDKKRLEDRCDENLTTNENLVEGNETAESNTSNEESELKESSKSPKTNSTDSSHSTKEISSELGDSAGEDDAIEADSQREEEIPVKEHGPVGDTELIKNESSSEEEDETVPEKSDDGESSDTSSAEENSSQTDRSSQEVSSTETNTTSQEISSSSDNSTEETSSEGNACSQDGGSAEKSSQDESASQDESSTENSSQDESSTENSSQDESSTENSSQDESSTENSSQDESSTENSSQADSSTEKSSQDESSTETDSSTQVSSSIESESVTDESSNDKSTEEETPTETDTSTQEANSTERNKSTEEENSTEESSNETDEATQDGSSLDTSSSNHGNASAEITNTASKEYFAMKESADSYSHCISEESSDKIDHNCDMLREKKPRRNDTVDDISSGNLAKKLMFGRENGEENISKSDENESLRDEKSSEEDDSSIEMCRGRTELDWKEDIDEIVVLDVELLHHEGNMRNNYVLPVEESSVSNNEWSKSCPSDSNLLESSGGKNDNTMIVAEALKVSMDSSIIECSMSEFSSCEIISTLGKSSECSTNYEEIEMKEKTLPSKIEDLVEEQEVDSKKNFIHGGNDVREEYQQEYSTTMANESLIVSTEQLNEEVLANENPHHLTTENPTDVDIVRGRSALRFGNRHKHRDEMKIEKLVHRDDHLERILLEYKKKMREDDTTERRIRTRASCQAKNKSARNHGSKESATGNILQMKVSKKNSSEKTDKTKDKIKSMYSNGSMTKNNVQLKVRKKNISEKSDKTRDKIKEIGSNESSTGNIMQTKVSKNISEKSDKTRDKNKEMSSTGNTTKNTLQTKVRKKNCSEKSDKTRDKTKKVGGNSKNGIKVNNERQEDVKHLKDGRSTKSYKSEEKTAKKQFNKIQYKEYEKKQKINVLKTEGDHENVRNYENEQMKKCDTNSKKPGQLLHQKKINGNSITNVDVLKLKQREEKDKRKLNENVQHRSIKGLKNSDEKIVGKTRNKNISKTNHRSILEKKNKGEFSDSHLSKVMQSDKLNKYSRENVPGSKLSVDLKKRKLNSALKTKIEKCDNRYADRNHVEREKIRTREVDNKMKGAHIHKQPENKKHIQLRKSQALLEYENENWKKKTKVTTFQKKTNKWKQEN